MELIRRLNRIQKIIERSYPKSITSDSQLSRILYILQYLGIETDLDYHLGYYSVYSPSLWYDLQQAEKWGILLFHSGYWCVGKFSFTSAEVEEDFQLPQTAALSQLCALQNEVLMPVSYLLYLKQLHMHTPKDLQEAFYRVYRNQRYAVEFNLASYYIGFDEKTWTFSTPPAQKDILGK